MEDILVHLLCCHCKPEPFMMTVCAERHHFLKAHIEHTVSRRAKNYRLLQMKGFTSVKMLS